MHNQLKFVRACADMSLVPEHLPLEKAKTELGRHNRVIYACPRLYQPGPGENEQWVDMSNPDRFVFPSFEGGHLNPMGFIWDWSRLYEWVKPLRRTNKFLGSDFHTIWDRVDRVSRANFKDLGMGREPRYYRYVSPDLMIAPGVTVKKSAPYLLYIDAGTGRHTYVTSDKTRIRPDVPPDPAGSEYKPATDNPSNRAAEHRLQLV